MAIRVTWPNFGLPDSLTLYRSSSPFTIDNLPATTVTLAPADTSYVDRAAQDNAVSWYMVVAKKAGRNDQFSKCTALGNYKNTGPGPSTILRGNWDIGYFGSVAAAELYTISGLRTALGITNTQMPSPPADTTMTTWHKWIYKGKIIFIPNNVFTAATTIRWSDLYNLGLIYGTAGPGSAPMPLVDGAFQPPITANVEQKTKVTTNGVSYIVRTPRVSTNPTNAYLTPKNGMFGSEWYETMCRLATNLVANDIDPTNPYRWGDNPGAIGIFNFAATPFFAAAGSSLGIGPVTWADQQTRINNAAVSTGYVQWLPVLEIDYS